MIACASTFTADVDFFVRDVYSFNYVHIPVPNILTNRAFLFLSSSIVCALGELYNRTDLVMHFFRSTILLFL